MEKILNYDNFIKESLKKEALSLIKESIDNFMDTPVVTEVDVDQLNQAQCDVLDKYDLPDIDIQSIKDRISDAISRKVIDTNINVDA
jgi:hypothetical protein